MEFLNFFDFIVFSQISNTVAIYAVSGILECIDKTKDVSFLFEIDFDTTFIEFIR